MDVFIRIQEAILHAEKVYVNSEGDRKKKLALSILESSLTPEQKQSVEPLLSCLIDQFVALMQSDRMIGLGSSCCLFRKG